jgi:hypothetical protein
MAERRSRGEIQSAESEGVWALEAGVPRAAGKRPKTFGRARTEQLTYDNPYGMVVERVWFDGKIVYAIESGEIELDLQKVKVAQEYQIVYSVELDPKGKLTKEPERVEGQYNIYDSVPGMDKYSPLWQFNYVIVPRDYKPNSLRSEEECRKSGYPIRQSTVVEN